MPLHIRHAPSDYEPSAKHYLIFFIPGNPGFIVYYKTFLATLNHLLSRTPTNDDNASVTFEILGQSLPGFEDEDEDKTAAGRFDPYGLQETIDHTFELLTSQRISNGVRRGDSFDGVIVIGHSVGAYILLELLRKMREKSSSEIVKAKGGILLFPTVMDLAQSPNGLRFGALFRIPNFPRLFSTFLKGLFWPMPRAAIKWFVGLVTRMPDDAADATTNLFVYKRALWQALYLASDEMNMISEDRWDENIWGVELPDLSSKDFIPKLIFYFGQKDHWVADHTRDALIGARGTIDGQTVGKPKMMIDQDGIPHAFCIRHGEIVAEKVKVWVGDILGID